MTDFYKKLSLECSSQQVAVDLFMLNSQYADMATVCKLCFFDFSQLRFTDRQLWNICTCHKTNVRLLCFQRASLSFRAAA